MLYPFELRALNNLRGFLCPIFTNFTLIPGREAVLVSSRFIALVTSVVETIFYQNGKQGIGWFQRGTYIPNTFETETRLKTATNTPQIAINTKGSQFDQYFVS
jgi:hypothetical protein